MLSFFHTSPCQLPKFPVQDAREQGSFRRTTSQWALTGSLCQGGEQAGAPCVLYAEQSLILFDFRIKILLTKYDLLIILFMTLAFCSLKACFSEGGSDIFFPC